MRALQFRTNENNLVTKGKTMNFEGTMVFIGNPSSGCLRGLFGLEHFKAVAVTLFKISVVKDSISSLWRRNKVSVVNTLGSRVALSLSWIPRSEVVQDWGSCVAVEL